MIRELSVLKNPSSLRTDVKKYFNYLFETKGFTTPGPIGLPGECAVQAAKAARGAERGPAIFIQGIMPRSGTVYVGELLRRHPDLYAFPHQLWEVPALQLVDGVAQLQSEFLQAYEMNQGKMGEGDFLPLFGASLLAYLHLPIPPEQRLLAKMPSVQYLSHFFAMFPHENLLILVRDGRDVVHSTLRTWPHLNFIQVCLRWNRSAQAVLNTCEQLRARQATGYWLAHYEMALQNPEAFVREACRHLGLDENRYPYDLIDNVRVIGSSKLEPQHNVSWRHLKKPKNFRPMEYWKEWSALKKKLFKLIAGRSLMELGYCKDLNW
jgi:protein-tyrosine sulfotransferase